MQTIIDKAKANGFKVYGFQKDREITQIFIANENGVCTVSLGLGGFSLSTCHKPQRNFGTGFGLEESLGDITVEDMNRAISVIKPHWAGSGYVKKWANWEEYVSRETILKYFEL